jgi:iron complex outermembrane receptor protein
MNKLFLFSTILAFVNYQSFASQEITYTQRLNETLISGESFETTVIDTPKNITIITSEDIEKKGAKNVAEALQGVPNLLISNLGGSDPVFDLRGQGASAVSNIIVLLDGVPLNSHDNSGYKTGSISIDLIEKIEVIPSGGSILYGDGAIGGTINIITKVPLDKKNYGSIDLEVSSYDTFRSNVNYGTTIFEKTLLDLNYSSKNSHGYRSNSKDDVKDFRIKITQLLEDGDFNFGYSYSEYDFLAQGAIYGKDNVENNPKQIGAWFIEGTNKYNNYSINISKKFLKNFNFTLNSKFGKQEYREDSWKYDTDSIYIKPQFKYTYLIFGADYSEGKTKILKSWSGSGNITKKSEGIFVLNKINIENFEFQQGYRKQYIDYKLKDFSNKHKFNEDAFDFSINYLLSDSNSIYLNFNTAFRTPNTDELNYWNGDFETQTNKTIEIGSKNSFGNTFINIAIFHIETKNEIIYAPLKASNYSYNQNLDGKNQRLGFEFTVEHYFKNLTLIEQIGYINHKILSGSYDGKEIPGVPKLTGHLGLSYNLLPSLALNADLYYHGKAYAFDNFNNTGEKLNDYITCNTNLNYHYTEDLTIYCGINNIFNKKYYDYVLGSDLNYAAYYPANGRNYYAGFKYKF